ncbi:hypothetical protein ACTMTI_46935 [Nonomuraea sp. H19]|uniref:hypothetical protein n=1 Tax=Nonomuraea sp. H19 TaxID=3452206 RepID=UPI003F88D421
MKLVVQVRLLPTPEQAAALQATLRAANKAADLVSRIAFQQRCFRNFDLRKHAYEQVKADCGLAAQAAQHVIKKVCDAYRALHANLAAGRIGAASQSREQTDLLPLPGGSAVRRPVPVLAARRSDGVDLDDRRAAARHRLHRLGPAAGAAGQAPQG